MPRAQLLTLSQAGKYTGLVPSTINYHRKHNNLPSKKKNGVWSFSKKDLDELMETAKPRKKSSKRIHTRAVAKRVVKQAKSENLVSRLKAIQKDLANTGFESVLITQDDYVIDDVDLSDHS